MKFCSNCGAQLPDEAYVCSTCGNVVSTVIDSHTGKKDSGLVIAIKILMVLGTLVSGFATIPFISFLWCIPMTVSYFKSIKNNRRIGVAFKVCTLLFVSLPAGILMFCDQNH